MITNDLNRAEFTSNGSSTAYVFQNSDASIQVKVKDKSHIKVNVITTGNFTATDGSSVFDHEDHGHANGEIVTLTAGTSLPIGLKSGTDYYIVNKTDDTFKLEASVGGGAISVSGTGSGTLTWTKTILKTLDTDYSVAINKDNTATITWLSGKIPSNTVKFFFLREVPYTQEVDLLNNSLIEAESLENQLDLIVNQTQQLKAKTDRNLKFDDNLLINDATEAQASLNVTATDRANKSLKFDAQGSISVTSVNVDDAEDYVLEAKSYATEDGAVVKTYSAGVATDTSPVSYSALEHASGSTVTTGSAKDWATKAYGSAVTSGAYSALHHATDSLNSATAANASADAVAAFFDAFNDKYLGSMSNSGAQGTNPSIACSWDKNSSTITVASKTHLKVGQVVTGTGMPSPAPNIISISSSTDKVVVSDNMDAASGGNQDLTFTGYGVYGTYDGSKLGPSTDNDNGALSDGLLYFNTTNDVIMVYDETTSKWKQIQPTSAEQTNIDTLTTGKDGTASTSGTTLNIALVNTLVPELDHITLLGVSSVIADMALLGVSAVISNMSAIATGYDGTTNTSGTNTNLTQIDVCADNIDSLNTVASNAEGNAISMAIALG